MLHVRWIEGNRAYAICYGSITAHANDVQLVLLQQPLWASLRDVVMFLNQAGYIVYRDHTCPYRGFALRLSPNQEWGGILKVDPETAHNKPSGEPAVITV